jgi:hypothetical protein
MKLELPRVNSDREDASPGSHLRADPRPCAGGSVKVLKLLEREQVAFGLEARKIIRRKELAQICRDRQLINLSGIAEWSMQENPYAIADATAPQGVPQREQMIVLYPYDIILAQEAHNFVRKPFADPAIGLVILAQEADKIRTIVEQRP